MRFPLVIFAQSPPPEHGQSRMVALLLEALAEVPEFAVTHVDARFSRTIDEVGESSLHKLRLCGKFMAEGLRVRAGLNRPVLYYIPGPVKWSAVVRDWLLLSVLRRAYPQVVFHWHAIGQGEWAHGSPRVALPGPKWLDRLGRRLSAWVLEEPSLSISVSPTSTRDAVAVGSTWRTVVANGIVDPDPQVEAGPERRRERFAAIARGDEPVRWLFLSHGTKAKGLLDCLAAIEDLFRRESFTGRGELTLAGGVDGGIQGELDVHLVRLQALAGDRLVVRQLGFVAGDEKSRCYAAHDVFIAPSQWESFGLTVVEAMAHRMVVVACASDGVTGVLPADYPFLAPVAQAAKLADRLEACWQSLADPEFGVELGESLRARFLEHFQLAGFRTEMVESLRELAQRRAASRIRQVGAPDKLQLLVYLADQNPKLGRSLGISRMTEVVLEGMAQLPELELTLVTSNSSLSGPLEGVRERRLPWSTRPHLLRLVTDHLHPMVIQRGTERGVFYFPKGFLPFSNEWSRPSVVTIHDTIIQFYSDHYPKWRHRYEYRYWAVILKHTLRHADAVLTVSESSKRQIEEFMERFGIPAREIVVTYEPCVYESVPQPEAIEKLPYVVHFASREPHKRTAILVQRWVEQEERTRGLELHLIGKVPCEVEERVASCPRIVRRPFLEEPELQHVISRAKALIFPSEIEGFGLPAIEAYYLGTPVVFRKGTSVEEVLAVTTTRGGFEAKQPSSMFDALDEVLEMSPEEIRACGLKLREAYASEKVIQRMMQVFESLR